MQSCCFGFGSTEAVGQSFSAAFHHAERAPRVTSSLTAESPTIRSFETILDVDIRILATRVRRARETRKWILLLIMSCSRFELDWSPFCFARATYYLLSHR